jgi:hypothetical protein
MGWAHFSPVHMDGLGLAHSKKKGLSSLQLAQLAEQLIQKNNNIIILKMIKKNSMTILKSFVGPSRVFQQFYLISGYKLTL